jgi:general secretion pathway protein E
MEATKEKSLSIEYVTGLLKTKGLLTDDQIKEISITGEAQRARIKKQIERDTIQKSSQAIKIAVSSAEVIASFKFDLPGKPGKLLTEDYITELIAEELGMDYLKIDPLKLNLDMVTANISRPFAQRHLVVPVGKENGTVLLAVADPFDTEALSNLERTTKMRLKLILSSKSDILKIVREFYGFRSSMVAAQKEMGRGNELGNLEQYVKLKGDDEIEATDQHVVNAVEYLLHYAYDQKASDIHIEPKRYQSLVRMRIDGILHNIHTIPRTVHPSMVSRIKTLARMNIAEKRKPQDGRIKTSYKDREVELRISTLPTAFGEKVVLRIFDPEILFHNLKELGFEEADLDIFTSFLKKNHGIMLVTGPTAPEVNIVTIEDPIEMVMEEFNQIGVQPQIGIDFASSIRTILRQDPDIIMIGEIRDADTASNAVQAALTGHLVLSTLHTNDAPSAITRLIDLGVPSFLISSTVLGIMAQRLVRKICEECKVEKTLGDGEIELLDLDDKTYKVWEGAGCARCRGTGYKGRVGIFEIMEITNAFKSELARTQDLEILRATAISGGMTSLRKAAIEKMLQGVTTAEEIISVTG